MAEQKQGGRVDCEQRRAERREQDERVHDALDITMDDDDQGWGHLVDEVAQATEHAYTASTTTVFHTFKRVAFEVAVESVRFWLDPRRLKQKGRTPKTSRFCKHCVKRVYRWQDPVTEQVTFVGQRRTQCPACAYISAKLFRTERWQKHMQRIQREYSK